MTNHAARSILMICSLLATAAPGQVLAEDDGGVLETIVVTAQKREQNAQDVGVSIAALQGSDLKALGITNSGKIAALVPALDIASVGGNDQQMIVNLRGVSQNDFGDHNEAPVAIFVDDAYVSWLGAVGMTTYDMQRVEVLRGPQGTLFGRNATGGLINFISKAPSQEFDANIGAEMSSHNSYRVDGAVGGGLADHIAMRLAGIYERQGNYITNLDGPDLGHSRQYALRAQVLFDMGSGANLLMKGEYESTDGGGSTWTHVSAIQDPTRRGIGTLVGPNQLAYPTTLFGTPGCKGCDAVGFNDTDGNLDVVHANTPGAITRNISNLQAKLNVPIGDVTITSISDYRSIHRTYSDDTDATPYTLDNFIANIDFGKQVSEELRAAAKQDRLDWVAGAYFLNINGHYSDRLNTIFTGDPTVDYLANRWSLRTITFAGFSQGEYQLSDKLSLIAGARWTEDKKHFEYANTDGLGGGVIGGGLVFSDATVGALDRMSKGSANFKVGVNLRPVTDVLLYSSVTRGTKAGGYTASLAGLLSPSDVPYKEEVLTSYESGFKSTMLDGKLRFNGSGFFYDYKDYQAFLFKGLDQHIVNLNARIYGAEFELSGRPASGLDVMLGASLLHARALDVPMPDGSLADQTLPQAPAFSLKGLARKSFEIGPGRLAFQIDATYQTKSNLNVVNHDTTAVDAYALANGRISYSSLGDRYTVSFFVNNLFDKRYVNSAFDLSSFATGGFAIRSYNAPRWIGGEVRVNFK